MFDVINRSYQGAADNIVGRMTIASLDAHMCILDLFGDKVLPLPRDSHPRLIGGTPYTRPRAALTGSSFALTSADIVRTNAIVADTRAGSGFSPPLSGFPQDMQETVRRSNLAKVPV
jgi:hypothetical protein